MSESKLHGAEKREQRTAGVDVFEPLSGLERGSAAGEDDVFCERRPVLDAETRSLRRRCDEWVIGRAEIRAARCVRNGES